MYIKKSIKKEIAEAISKVTPLKAEKAEEFIEKPPEGIHADFAFPCFYLGKILKKKPHYIAKEISEKIKKPKFIKAVENSGPYVNFFVDWQQAGRECIRQIIRLEEGYGKIKSKGKLLIEYAQPNTHKSFHIGHVRNIILGESICRILEFTGKKVIRANYQGDIGPHVAKCLWGLLRLGLKEPEKEKGEWLGEVYSEANKLLKEDKEKEKEVYEINRMLYKKDTKITKLWEKTRRWSLEHFEEIYKDFGVKFDRYYFESEVEGEGLKLAEELVKKGIAKISEGAIIIDMKEHGLGVFVLVTKDKTPLYSAKDIALAMLQYKEYKPDKIIHVVGSEQITYFKQLFKALEMIDKEIAKREVHIPYSLVNLATGKVSSREGRLITYNALKKEVNREAERITAEKNRSLPKEGCKKVAEIIAMGSIKYDMIKVSPEKPITFDWKSALNFEGNTAPYIQYTHARACSILKKAGVKKPGGDILISSEKEEKIVRCLSEFPEVVYFASRDFRPHYIANFLYELSSCFNDFYQHLPVIKADEKTKESRLAIVYATKTIIKTGLHLLGIEAPEEM